MVGAINAGAAAVRADPASPDALRLRAQTMRTQYGLVAALPWFESALARDPYAHDTLIDYAATLGDAGRSRDMLAAVRRAMAVRPGSPQGLYLQSVLAARAGDLATARSVLDKAGRGLAGVPGALLLSGSIGLAAGEADDAHAGGQGRTHAGGAVFDHQAALWRDAQGPGREQIDIGCRLGLGDHVGAEDVAR